MTSICCNITCERVPGSPLPYFLSSSKGESMGMRLHLVITHRQIFVDVDRNLVALIRLWTFNNNCIYLPYCYHNHYLCLGNKEQQRLFEMSQIIVISSVAVHYFQAISSFTVPWDSVNKSLPTWMRTDLQARCPWQAYNQFFLIADINRVCVLPHHICLDIPFFF